MTEFEVNQNSKLDIVEVLKEIKNVKELFTAFAITPEDNILVLKAICEMQQTKISELEHRLSQLEKIRG